jgi:hypothetical protein
MRDRSGEARRDRAAIELRRVLLEEAHVLEGVTARLPRARASPLTPMPMTPCRADLGYAHRGSDYRAHGTHLLLGHGLEVPVGELQRASLREQCRVGLQRLAAAAAARSARQVEELVRVDVEQEVQAQRQRPLHRVLGIQHLPRLHLGRRVELQPAP